MRSFSVNSIQRSPNHDQCIPFAHIIKLACITYPIPHFYCNGESPPHPYGHFMKCGWARKGYSFPATNPISCSCQFHNISGSLCFVINCFSLCQFIRSLLRFFYSSLLRFFQAYPLCCVFESPLSREQPGNLLWLCLERGGFCYLCYSICFIVSDEMSPGDTQMKLQGEKTGRKGQLAVATEVSNSSFLKGW